MNSPALGLRVASLLFGLTAVCHLARILFGTYLQLGGWIIGRRWSAVAVVVCATLCVWLWMLAYKSAKSEVEAPPAKPAT
jgi:hypothetical protein